MEMAKVHRSFGVVPIHWFVERAVPVKITQALEGIEQIIANGLTNSCKFCADETNGFIRIEVRMPEPNVSRLLVEVHQGVCCGYVSGSHVVGSC
jgi:hypothetical protein